MRNRISYILKHIWKGLFASVNLLPFSCVFADCSLGITDVSISPQTVSACPCDEKAFTVDFKIAATCSECYSGPLHFSGVFYKDDEGVPPSSVSTNVVITCDCGCSHSTRCEVEIIAVPSCDDSPPGDSQEGSSSGSSPKKFASRMGNGGDGIMLVPKGAPTMIISLGKSASGNYTGHIELDPALFFFHDKASPDMLKVSGSEKTGLDVVYDAKNEFFYRQIMAAECFVNISTNSTGESFALEFYHPHETRDSFASDGSYVLKSRTNPFVVYEIGPFLKTNGIKSIPVVERRGGVILTERSFYFDSSSPAGMRCGVSYGAGAMDKGVQVLSDNQTVKYVRGPNGFERKEFLSYVYVNGEEKRSMSIKTLSDTQAVTNRYEYVTDTAKCGFGNIASKTEYTGLKIEYAYDHSNRIIRETRTFPDGEVRVIEKSYEPLDVSPHCPDGVLGDDILPDDGSIEIATPRIETEKVNGIVVSKTLRFVSIDTMEHRIIEEVRLLNPLSDEIEYEWENPANERTYSDYKPKDSCRACSERPVLLKKPDGTIERYSYGSGDYTPGEDGLAGVFTPRSGGEAFRTVLTRYPAQTSVIKTNSTVALAQIPYKTTREVTVEVRASKKVLLKEQYVCTGSGRDDFERISWRATTRDELGQETLVVSSDGSRTEKAYIGNRLNTMRSADGSVVTYIYDSLSRVISETQSFSGIRPNITTSSSYDPEGCILSRTISSDSLSETETTEYDGFGRMAMSASPDGIITKYLYDTDAIAGLETKTVIRGFGTPCAITNETVSYADGRIKETRLNGKLKSTYTYGIDENGYKWTKTYEGEKGVNSARWTLAKTNPLGQTIEEIRPGFGGTTLVTSNIYNSAGNLLASRLSDSQGKILNSSLFCYDSSGQRYLSVEDLNRNSIIDFAETDRVVSNDTQFVKIDGDWWRESSSWQTRENNSAALTRISCVRERLTGIGVNNLASEIKSFDIHGNLTTTRTYRDRNALTLTQITDTPDSIFDVKAISIAGLLSTNITASGIISDYTYDALGRQLSKADGRGNLSQAVYDEKGRLIKSIDGAGNATTYTYDALGRQTSVTDPNGMTVMAVYDAEGHVISQRGATYPVDYAYDEFGNKVAMMCYREEGRGNRDITRWFYDEATGLVTNKVYADGKGPSYTYTPDGKLASRTWARGVVTTYAYDNSGALTNTVYSDDTPTISMVYDRVGNMLSAVTDGVCTNLYAYSLTGLCTNEVQNGATIARSYDTLGRSTGYTLQASQNSVDISTIKQSNNQTLLSYDALGRIASLSIITNDSSNIPTFQHSNIQTFTYSYLPGTDIVDGYTCGNFSRKIEFEPLRNLVAAVTNSYANRVISAFDYTNDAAGRRTAISRSGEAFGDLSGATDSYGYNSRNEVISARRTKNNEIIHGFNEDFEYDPIGNRIWSTTYNELGEPKTSQYIANNLNQYTSRTVPGYAAVRGHADADATVTVNEKPTCRYGEYFFGSDEFNNTSSSVNATLETVAVKPGATEEDPDEIASVTNSVYLAKSPVTYEYDDDGNQTLVTTKTGTWRVTYNGENRPVRWERLNSSTPNSNTPSLIAMTFDHQGRRREYLEVAANGMTNSLKHFTYDNYLQIANCNLQHATGNLQLFVWDPTEPVATRPLVFYQPNAPPQLYAHDGNKNVSELVSVNNGAITAHYEYSSFGEVILSSGNFALVNPFRFSSEYADDSLGLVYYNYRHYEPVTGRWLSRDSIEEIGGSNLYGFCGNNSLFNVDILGNEIYKSITFKRLHAQKINALKSVFISDFPNGDYYGHWWVEFDGESYGWWPLRPVGLYDTLKGVPGEVNGRTSFSGTETKDPHHGDSANEEFHPRRRSSGMMQHGQAKGQKCKCTNEDDAKDCLRSFASSYSGNWSYPWNSCHTFQLKSMTDCCLSR